MLSLPELFSKIKCFFIKFRKNRSDEKRMCLGAFSRRGAVAEATIYPCAECASSRSFFISQDAFSYEIKCALAHSRTEARLLWQPSTPAPSAHPRRAFLSYRSNVSYTIKKDDTGSSDRNRPLLIRKHCLLSCPYQYFHRLQLLYTVNP